MGRDSENDKLIDILVTHIKDVRADLKDDIQRMQSQLYEMNRVLAINTQELAEHKEGVAQNRKHIRYIEERLGKTETEHKVMMPQIAEVCDYILLERAKKQARKEIFSNFFEYLGRLKLLWYFIGGGAAIALLEKLISYLG